MWLDAIDPACALCTLVMVAAVFGWTAMVLIGTKRGWFKEEENE